jgi:HAD superfamily hydrolase (TIGR01549 family)
MTDIRVVLFDLDETLFDHQHACLSGLTAVAERHTHLQRQPLAELELAYFRLLNAGHADVLAGRISRVDARTSRFRRLVEHFGGEVSAAEAATLAALYQSSYLDARRPIAGAVDLLQHLHGRVAVGVVTNNFAVQQQDTLRCCGLTGFVSFLVTSEDVGFPKPHRAMFDAALARAGCAPYQAVMVGDSWESDVMGALQAGIRPVWFNRRRAPPPGPDVAMLDAFEPLDAALTLLLGTAAIRPEAGLD